MPEAVLVSAVRTPVGRAPKGTLSTTRPDDLAALAIGAALDRVPALRHAEVDDVILGCAQPEGESGWNMARMAALRARLPVEIPGMTVNRLCSSGLQAIALADQRIRTGGDRVIVAGGAETMSMLPFGGLKPSPNPWLAEHYPAALLTMGLTAERVARHYEISREDQDAFALASHRKALAAQAAGRFDEELVPVAVATSTPGVSKNGSKAGKPDVSEALFAADEGPRADTSAEALAKLKPVFHAQGNSNCREFFTDIGRSGGGGSDGGPTGAGAWRAAAGAAGGVCRDRMLAGGDGNRADYGHSGGAAARGADSGSD